MNPTSAPATGALESLVAEAADEFLARLDRGETPDPQEFADRHPEAADAIRDVLAALVLIRQGPIPREVDGAGEPGDLGVLGDFRLLREVGRGGMGVVYEAEQISLKRRVALKILPFAVALDPRRVQRFQNEVAVAARLTHPHIVPVHAVGCERGVHYFAMRFIEGRSLAEVVAELRESPSPQLPRDFRQVAEWGRQAADALEYAHQMGIVHRDIKPANLMVSGGLVSGGLVSGGKVASDQTPDHQTTRHQTPTLWVTDFGLAQGQTETRLTLTGDVLGTLRYMSPEQALARPSIVDHRVDIYSLGVTLYELATLHPAFDAQDRQVLLQQIADGNAISPRRRNPIVPRDLETIILKAMAREPAARYATAQELADDLQAFQEQRAIRARRPTWSERGWRWLGRHRTMTTAATIVLLIAAMAFAISSYVIARQRDEAEAGRLQARRAVQELVAEVEEWLSATRGRDAPREEILLQVLRFYEAQAPEKTKDPTLLFEMARAHRVVGQVQQRRRDKEGAAAAYERAAGMLQELMTQTPQDPTYRQEWAMLLFSRSDMQRGDRADLPAKRRDHEEALQIVEKLMEEYPKDVSYQQKALEIHLALAKSPTDAVDRVAAADAHYDQALKLAEQLVAEHPNDNAYHLELNRINMLLSMHFRQTNRHEAAKEVMDKRSERTFQRFRAANQGGQASVAESPPGLASSRGVSQFPSSTRVRMRRPHVVAPIFIIITCPELRDLLHVTAEEAKQLDAAHAQWSQEEDVLLWDRSAHAARAQSMRPHSPMEPERQKLEERVDQVLGPDRFNRLKQVQLQLFGVGAVTGVQMSKDLGLSDEQTAAIRSVFLKEASQGTRESRERGVLELLTKEQREMWHQRTGEPLAPKVRRALEEAQQRFWAEEWR